MEGITFGTKLKLLREKSGLNQLQLANFLEVHQSYISKCENGERQLSVDILERACSLFGCTLSEFTEEDDISEPLVFAFRASSIENDDLMAIAEINKIALNIKEMNHLLRTANCEREN